MIDVDTINVFLEVAKTGNMSIAAKNLYITQSAMSQRMSALEFFVGQTLFNRKYGGMELNSFGKEFLNVCKNLKKDIEILNDWVMERKNIVRGHIKIITVSSLVDNVFPIFLKKFFKKYNDVKFTIDVHTSDHVEEGVLNGNYDLGIIVGSCRKKSQDVVRLMENKIYMVCSKDHPFAKKKSVTDKDLKETKIIWHSEKKSRTVLQGAKKLKLRSIEEMGDIYLSNMESCKTYVLNGLGVAFIADNHIKDELEKGLLVRLGNFVLDRPIYLISRKEQYQNNLIKLFKEELRAHCRV